MRLLFMLFFVCVTLSLAQTPVQQGVVKTRGRMVNGKLQPGQGLPGATVHVKGNGNEKTLGVKNQNGSFSFNVPGTIFNVTKVQKQGYQLVDADLTTKPVQYSKNTLYIVMETPQQQAQDKLASERKIRRTLETQLHAREDEIEALKEQNKITMEEYRKALQQLYADQESNEKLIKEMAERYATLDYDQLDEFYRQVSYYIEEGELTCADSLLRTRGNVVEQVAEQLQKGQVIQAQEEQLNKAKAVHKLDNEELAHRCYSKYEIFKSLYENDSAAFYLKLRASIDTSNVEWQNEVGWYLKVYVADYSLAKAYFQRMLRQSILQYGEKVDWTASAYNNLGMIFEDQGNYVDALKYYKKALRIGGEVFGSKHPNVAAVYNNIGLIYCEFADYKTALKYLHKALTIWERSFESQYSNIAAAYNNIGIALSELDKNTKAVDYHQKALDIRERHFGQTHPGVADSYLGLGTVFHRQKNYALALENYTRALKMYKTIFGDFHPSVARTYKNMAVVYGDQGDYAKEIELCFKELEVLERFYGAEHPSMADSYNNIGSAYGNQGNLAMALKYFQKAKVIYMK